ncbi:DUF2591 domain-containing protein [Enterobacter sichuanensis]|uniref:DUF2591 domain-containing protein n=1 Tax=Enterobacter sichuanensis TaxID=2071710 RepID=UPI00217EF2A4|nr:DUF2591 domain-containing protein [Enterobacter sichuanensis]
MDYSQLSDQEINIQVAKIMHPEIEVIESKSRPPSACVIGHLPSKWLDYCNNPADSWPIIEKQLIRITPVIIGGSATWVCSRDIHASAGDRALRAAMIVFLMMQDAKHA